MLDLTDTDLKQTRFYQDVSLEVEQNLILRLLQRRCGKLTPAMREQITRLSLPQLKLVDSLIGSRLAVSHRRLKKSLRPTLRRPGVVTKAGVGKCFCQRVGGPHMNQCLQVTLFQHVCIVLVATASCHANQRFTVDPSSLAETGASASASHEPRSRPTRSWCSAGSRARICSRWCTSST